MSNDTETEFRQAGQTILINQTQKKSNGIGTAGFVLSLIALFMGWVPVFGWIVWLLGLILSFVGVFKKPKGMAIAGMVISLLGLILIFVAFAGLGAAFAMQN
jgi:nucleoside recognition membrane protein YjiH